MADNEAVHRLSAAARKRAQKHALLGNASTAIVGMVTQGPFMMLYATDVLGFSTQAIAGIMALIPLLVYTRLLAVPVTRRIGLVKGFALGVAGQLLCVLGLLLIPQQHMGYALFAGLIISFYIAREMGMGNVWMPLMRSITTGWDRGRFFARMRFTFTTLGLLVSAGLAFVIGEEISASQYHFLLILVLLGLANSLFWVSRIPPPPGLEGKVDTQPKREKGHSWKILRTSPLLRRPLLIACLVTATMLPVMVLYLRQVLHVPANYVVIYTTLCTAGTALSLLLWGWIMDTVGFRSMLVGLFLLKTLALLFIWIVPPFPEATSVWSELTAIQQTGLLALWLQGFFTGAVTSGIGLANTATESHHTSDADSLEAMNLFAVIGMTFSAFVTFCQGLYLDHVVLPNGVTKLGSDWLHFDWFKIYAGLLCPLLLLLAIPIALKLPNVRPWFRVNDFFSTLLQAPWRPFTAAPRIYRESEEERLATARRLGERPNPLSLELLSTLLDDPSQDVKVEALRSLGYSGSPLAGKLVLEVLEDPERRSLWNHAAWALGQLRYQPGFDRLLSCLDPQYPPHIRAMSARALGKLGNPAAADPIALCLRDENKWLQVVSGCCYGLLRLDARNHADLVLDSFTRLRERADRYELLVFFTQWLQIPSQWLLRSPSTKSSWESLRLYVEEQSPSWIKARKETLAELDACDYAAIRHRYQKMLQTMVQPTEPASFAVAEALSRALEKRDQWGPIYVMATAWMLFR